MASPPEQPAIEPYAARRWRLSFRLSQLFVLMLVVALLLALYAQRRASDRRLAIARDEQYELESQLDKAQFVLRENGLLDQLKNLTEEQVRITVSDFYDTGASSARLNQVICHKITIHTLGPHNVYMEVGKQRTRLVQGGFDFGQPLDIEHATFSFVAHCDSGGPQFSKLNVSISLASSRGSGLAAQGESGIVNGPPEINRMIEFRLKSGDYLRGKRIEFFRRLEAPGRTYYLVIEPVGRTRTTGSGSPPASSTR